MQLISKQLQRDCLCRQKHCLVDSQPLEAAFYTHFRCKREDLRLCISSDVEQTLQSEQQTFVHELCERQLVRKSVHINSCNCCTPEQLLPSCAVQMLRVRHFCPGKELVLHASRRDGALLGYVCETGIIERLALQEFEGFVKLGEPQLVTFPLTLLFVGCSTTERPVLHMLQHTWQLWSSNSLRQHPSVINQHIPMLQTLYKSHACAGTGAGS